MSPERKPGRAGRARLDAALVSRGLAESRSMAQALILSGDVRVDGATADKASQPVSDSSRLEVVSPPPYVSRGGVKLEASLEAFRIDVGGKTCADVGASTGGFTDCLLQRGAAKVFAIDVGHGILHWKLRNDPRVVVMEGVNVRYLAGLPERIHLAAIDVAFISLRLVVPVVAQWLAEDGDILALVKPQFEAGRKAVGKGGVVRDPSQHRHVLAAIAGSIEAAGLGVVGVLRSPLRGPKGNVEFLMWGSKRASTMGDLPSAMEAAISPPSQSP
jgi:23S rRNA (cytidine1920-2'-O)/16S rRNA (cytidine1409-2'-O)-methyltransferase